MHEKAKTVIRMHSRECTRRQPLYVTRIRQNEDTCVHWNAIIQVASIRSGRGNVYARESQYVINALSLSQGKRVCMASANTSI